MITAVRVRPLLVGDIPALVGVLARAYESEANFELRLHSYLRMRAVATFVAERAGEPVGMVVGNDYAGSAYVSQMAVEPAMQRRGIATLLMDGLTAWTQSRGFAAIELDATAAGEGLYARYGYREAGRTDVYTNTRASAPPGVARRFHPDEREALFACDAHAFGGDRRDVLGLLIDSAPQNVFVVSSGRGLRGYAVAQPRSELLGPVIAADAQAAGALLDAARGRLPAAHRLSIPGSSAVAEVVTARGYQKLRSLAHMVRGTCPAAHRERIFARINLGQG